MKAWIDKIGLALLSVALLAATACDKFERRPLYELSNTHYVKVYVDTTILNYTTGFYDREGAREYPEFQRPEVLRLMLADAETGSSRTERFLQNVGRDEGGLYYDGYIIAEPGDYSLMSYNFGTEATILREPYLYGEIQAYTNHISDALLTKLPSYITRQQSSAASTSGDDSKATESEPIVYEPDHLYVAKWDYIHIPAANHIDTISVKTRQSPLAETVVESWYLQIRVRGAKYVSSIVGLLTGMGGKLSLVSEELTEPSTLYLEMLTTEENADGVATLYVTFNTFGRLDETVNDFSLNFDIVTIDGRGHTVELGNISSEFLKEDALQHRWILLDKIIEVPSPQPGTGSGDSGGFNPFVTDWETIEGDIVI